MNMRKERRIEERNTVLIRSAGSGRGPSTSLGVNAYTYDLSLGGTRLFTDRPFAEGTIIRIVIELAKTCQTVQIDGEVKWMRKNDAEGVYEIGVEFLHNISQTILSLIRHLYGMENGISACITPHADGEEKPCEAKVKAEDEPPAPLLSATPPPSGCAGRGPGSKRGKKQKGAPAGAAADQTGTPPRA